VEDRWTAVSEDRKLHTISGNCSTFIPILIVFTQTMNLKWNIINIQYRNHHFNFKLAIPQQKQDWVFATRNAK